MQRRWTLWGEEEAGSQAKVSAKEGLTLMCSCGRWSQTVEKLARGGHLRWWRWPNAYSDRRWRNCVNGDDGGGAPTGVWWRGCAHRQVDVDAGGLMPKEGAGRPLRRWMVGRRRCWSRARTRGGGSVLAERLGEVGSNGDDADGERGRVLTDGRTKIAVAVVLACSDGMVREEVLCGRRWRCAAMETVDL